MATPLPGQSSSAKTRGNSGRNPSQQDVRGDVAIPAIITEVPDVKNDEMNTWLNQLYESANLSESELKSYWQAFSYKGFNREEVLKQLKVAIPDIKLASQIIIAVALRGPQAGSQLKLSNGKTPQQMGIPASGGQGSKILTCNKIVAATADLAAHFLKRLNAPKRVNVDLPGWLQFPSAGSIKLPENWRKAHMEFSQKFSELIGGGFQETIYFQMETNAYLDPRLKLF
jgi:hypothetical protein